MGLISEYLIKAIRAAVVYNPEVQVAPSCILWPDKDRQWEPVISTLMAEIPELLTFQPEMTAFQAGRIMLNRLHYLANKCINFAFESTLASKTFAPWITGLRKKGYDFHLVFLWLPSEDFAINRVTERVKSGGHNVPEDTIRRRYHAGLKNFFELYQQITDKWFFYDNSATEPRLIAYGEGSSDLVVIDGTMWHNIEKEYGSERKK